MSVRQEISPSWRERLAACGLSRLDELLERLPGHAAPAGRWQRLGKAGLGGRERWRWELPGASQACVVFVKRYARPRLREQWDRLSKQTARGGRASWEYARAVELAEASVPAPHAVGFIEEMNAAAERRGVVLLAGVAGEPLDRVWQRLESDASPQATGMARHEFAVRLGRFVAAFHGTGLCHRDLYLCHIFAEVDPSAGRPPRFSVIDLARTFRPRLRRARWIVKDLAQLDAAARQVGASRVDRYRGLLAYLGLERGAPRVRWYAGRIAKKSDWIIRRAVRNGRPIVPSISATRSAHDAALPCEPAIAGS